MKPLVLSVLICAFSAPILANSDLVLTPAGYVPRSLTHRLEAGSHFLGSRGRAEAKNFLLDLLPHFPRFSATHSGWIADTGWTIPTGNSVVSFASTWQVPPEPVSQGGQTIFYFNGIENAAHNTILQPVLQWGSAANGGGQYWAVASWFVGAEGTSYTDPIQVQPGDTLVGVMTRTAKSGNSFSYNSVFENVSGTSLNVDDVSELVWFNETLEAYATGRCSAYPTGETAFKNIAIQTDEGTPNVSWNVENRETECGQHASVVSNSATDGEVDIFTN